MAVVCLHYDGSSTEGEEIAVRGPEFIIGRSDGDVTIPHDDQISSRHVKLVRRLQNGRHTWIVQDLGSTNGTFALIEEGVLREGHELLLGSRRYRLEIAPQSTAAEGDMPAKEHGQTGTWQSIASTSSSLPMPAPALVELKADGEGDRFEISGKETTIGTDDACDVVIEGDEFLSSRHARLWRDGRGRWLIKPIQALNGVWVRVGAIRLHRSGKFQIGEQRFSVRIP
ncbi:MAG: FHA domain-containing protein [Planctomycetes bacterium]|nr:FHA domain-containing protein [Planctomycetota bacterium]